MELTNTTLFLLTAIIALVYYCYMKLSEMYQYWKKRGVAQMKPLPIFGNLLNVIRMKISMGELYKEAYRQFPEERIVGVYEFFNPVLVIKDPVLIEKILVKDFQHFTDHTTITESTGLFATGLFQLRGDPWRSVRHKISPAFTSGKLKGMFNGMLSCTEEMLNRIDHNLNKDYALRDALAVYTIDVIANTVFGITVGNKEARDEFVRMGTSIFNTTSSKFIDMIIIVQFPKLAHLLGMKFMTDETQEYFKGLIRNTLKQRENSDIQHNDYTQQLLKLKHLGAIDIQTKDADDDYLDLENSAPTEQVEVSEELLSGQAFQFLSAGFDPLLCVSQYLLYDLALNPDVQNRLRDHINETLQKHNSYTYECIKDMTFLEQCLQETLRIHVLTPFLFRECTKNYFIPETNTEIYKGQKVIIPLNAIQTDPKYYENPEVYNPDRLPPNSFKNNFKYLPFGGGPRICIGTRYALIVMSLGIAKLITRYNFALSAKTKVPFDFNKKAIILLPSRDLLFNVSKV